MVLLLEAAPVKQRVAMATAGGVKEEGVSGGWQEDVWKEGGGWASFRAGSGSVRSSGGAPRSAPLPVSHTGCCERETQTSLCLGFALHKVCPTPFRRQWEELRSGPRLDLTPP